MGWRCGGPPRSKKFRVQKYVGKVFASIVGSRRHPPHWLIFKLPKYQHGVLLIVAGVICGTFKKKTLRGSYRRVHVAWQCPDTPGTCNSEVTVLPGLPISWSPTLFTESSPVGLPPVPWTEKTIDSSPFFVRRDGHCCRGYLVGRTFFWFFW